MNYQEQIEALGKMVENRFVKTKPEVKGPFTSGDYVRYQLNKIFGPDKWSSLILKGPDLVTLNDNNAYVQTVVRLSVEFANGSIVTHDDVGVWPLVATKKQNGNGSVGLGNTAPERYETVLKSVVTDGLKACTEHLGLCFRPLADKDLEKIVVNASTGSASGASTGSANGASTPDNKMPVNGNGNGKTTSTQPTYAPAQGIKSDPPTNAPTPSTTSTQPTNAPVSSTTYYIAATGSKFEFPGKVAREIANVMIGGTPGKNTDFEPAMAALPFFKKCEENGIELAKATEILRGCGMNLEKASAKVYATCA